MPRLDLVMLQATACVADGRMFAMYTVGGGSIPSRVTLQDL